MLFRSNFSLIYNFYNITTYRIVLSGDPVPKLPLNPYYIHLTPSYYLKNNNIKKNDRIAAILPNIPETVISFLSTAQLGAIWSSCSSDFGKKAIIDRFKQIEPKVLFTEYHIESNSNHWRTRPRPRR